MNKVTVSNRELLKILVENKQNHRESFLKAQEGFRNTLIEELDKRLENAKNGKKINMFISLPEPEDHTKDYDTIIKMVEMSVDDQTEMSQVDFQKYVMDQWEWKERATTTNMRYGINSA